MDIFRHRSLLFVLCATIGLPTIPATPLFAADTDTIDYEEQPIEEIVVTGSRIAHTEFTSPVPVQVIDMETATLSGQHDLTGILQESTLATSAPQINNTVGYPSSYFGDRLPQYGGNGVSTIDLRGLGVGRTLVLLNGRRLNPAGTEGTVSAVDLNTIPTSMIERIEILKDGASSVYGSDAVSGVINIITKKQLDGVHLNAWTSVPADSGGEANSANVSFGARRGDASFLFGIDYFDQSALRLADREWMQCRTDHVIHRETGEEISRIDPATGELKCYDAPAHDYVINWGDFPETGRDSRSLWDPAIEDWRAVGPAAWVLDHPSADRRQIVSPVRRISAHSFGNWPMRALGADAEGYYELLFNNRSSEQNRGPAQLWMELYDSPWSPFYNNEGWARDEAMLLAYMGTRSQEVDWIRGVLGATGTFSAGWSWDVSLGYGYSEGTYRSFEQLDDRRSHMTDLVEITPGVYDCAINQLPEADGSCVPINPYALIRDGLGYPDVFPQEILDYILFKEEGTTTYDQAFLTAYFSGDLFEMPAGIAKAVIGVDGRHESIDDTPDPERQAGNVYGYGPTGITTGSVTVTELFAELELPLLRNRPAAQELTLSMAGRYSDYDVAGSDTTYRLGLNWQIVDQLRLRSSYGTSFRAPALYESFLGATVGNAWLHDPCEDFQTDPYIRPNVYANCSAVLGDASGWNHWTSLITEGNAGRLEPETSTSLTAGLVLNFDAIGMAIALDYFEVEIEGEIGRFGPAELVHRCYDLPPEQFRQPDTICDFVAPRDPDSHQFDWVNDSYFNINRKYHEGIDLTAQYTFDVGPVAFVTDLRATKILELTREYFDGYTFDLNGKLGYADVNGQFDLRAMYRDWTLFYNVDYIAGQSSYDPESTSPYRDYWVLETDDVFYHGFSVSYDAESWGLTAGVRNLEDTRPPEVSRPWASHAGNAVVNSHYDLLGRRYFVNLSARF